MPAIDVVDSTWFAAPPKVVAALMADPSNWRRWWPGLLLEVDEWRGEKGVRWLVPAVDGSGLAGSAEIWLEPAFEGVVAHFFLRLDPPPGRQLSPRRSARIVEHYRRRTKQAFWTLADQLDPGRLARLTCATHSPEPVDSSVR
ncbi:MAG TPA: SRPBCC family protein [Jatrophihabitans sp.]|nr:SRPBCC family protein [Jatrophihabitans sp.]